MQGLTEFLPVSSSGHLVIFKELLHISEQGLSIEVYLHLGTLLSIIIYYSRDIFEILFFWRKNLKYMGLIILGSIPTAIIGFIIYKLTGDYTFNLKLIGVFYMINALFLYLVDRFQNRSKATYLKSSKNISIWDAIVIGAVQGLAAFPGISRSGSTVGTAIFRRISPEDAAKFSFLLSIPAIFGAFLLDFLHVGMKFKSEFFLPVAVSFVVGYIAIHIFIKMITSKKLLYFAIYTLLLGVFCILFL